MSAEQIYQCYQVYQEMTHMDINLRVWERALHDFLEHGYTPSDLELVLGHLLRENRRMNGAKFSLRLNTLLDYQYERFDGFLSEAKAQQRNRVKRTPAEKVLATRTGGMSRPAISDTSRQAGEVALNALRELKARL